MRWWHLRLVVNVLNGSTLLGVLLGALGRAHFQRGPRGLVLCTSYRLGFPRAGAFTVGNVILSHHEAGDLVRRQRLLLHEERHSTQYAFCVGLPMLLLYLLASAWSWVRGRDFSTHNLFERLASLEDGGYPLVSRRERERYVAPRR